MAEIHPFRGVRYNQQLITDLSKAICSPSDIITPKLQRELYCRSEYNFVRLEVSLDSDDDRNGYSKWQRAFATMEDWLDKGILQIDEVPAIYIHDHYFTYFDKEYKRRGIIAVVRLEEWDRMIIRRHEKILPTLKKDRLRQISTMKAHTSPLLAFFEDQGDRVYSLLSAEKLGKPIISLDNSTTGKHNVWPITDPQFINQICVSLAEKPLYIADGHHRYEGVLTYRAERLASCPATSRDDACNFVMMTLSSASAPGLIVRAFHRLIRGVPDSVLSGLLMGLKEFFDVEVLSLHMPNVWQTVNSLLGNVDLDSPDEVVMVLFGLDSNNLFVLRARNFEAISSAMPASQSDAYKRLDVSIADQIIVEKLLQITGDKKEKLLSFNLYRQDAVRKVLENKYQLALLLRPTRVEQIIKVADAGETMPEKSTRFYPKPFTGFVFYRMV